MRIRADDRTQIVRRGLVGLGLALACMACEGNGSQGDGLVIKNQPISPSCTPVAGFFPSGLGVLSRGSGKAVLAQSGPPGIGVYGLDAARPVPLVFANIGTDSDLDGLDDGEANRTIFGFPLRPVMGELRVLRDDLALVSTSSYEQVLAYDPRDATKVGVFVDVPVAVPAGLYPLLPSPGTAELRAGVSTLACIHPPTPIDSRGDLIDPNPLCSSLQPSYPTSLTAGKDVAGGRLFVATSNLNTRNGGRFMPGTVLVYEWIDQGGTVTVRPDADTPVLFTTAFNPTGVARVVTPGGRELVLVTLSGAIGAGSGASNILTEAAIDVIDPSVPRIVAQIPLGFAGPSFEGAAVDPTGSLAWVGSSSQRQLFAVDLRALDDSALYVGNGPPVILDGMTVGFDDARVFTADHPFVLPDRADGPSSQSCDGFTHVAVNTSGSEAYATDYCDGTFTRIRLDLAGMPAIPYPAGRFELAGQSKPFSPVDSLGSLRSPSTIAVRPGVPGIDYTAPDVLVVVGQPDAQLCMLRIESQ
jgi:hypothetical protein